MEQDEWYTVLIAKFAPLAAIKKMLRQADSDMPVGVFLMLCAVFTLVGLGVALIVPADAASDAGGDRGGRGCSRTPTSGASATRA